MAPRPLLVALVALLCSGGAAARRNPCDVTGWDDLAGTNRTDPDRPCHVKYNRKTYKIKMAQRRAKYGDPAAAAAALEVMATAKGAKVKGPMMFLHIDQTNPSSSNLLSREPTPIKALFWGPQWKTPGFVKDKISGIDQFFTAHAGSGYSRTVDEYTGADGLAPGDTVYQGHVIDTSASSDGYDSSVIGAKVCSALKSYVQEGGYYPVFVDMNSANSRNYIDYCAWHDTGFCTNGAFSTTGGAVRIAYGFHFGDFSADDGCLVPSESYTVTSHSPELASMADSAAHELEEARTDPYMGGYADKRGAENADKCQSVHQTVTLSDGSQWDLQGEWSNNAFLSKSGYGKREKWGCIFSG